MDKDILFTGMSTQGPDGTAAEGALLAASGAAPSSAGLAAPVPPEPLFPLLDGEEVMFVHRTPEFSHIITQTRMEDGSYEVAWIDEDRDYQRLSVCSSPSRVSRITATGGTLVLLSSGGLVYAVWKQAAAGGVSSYRCLSHMPVLDIRFSLRCRLERERIGIVTLQKDKDTGRMVLSPSEEQRIFGAVNKFVADYSVRRGRFMFPFLVRYAYRLYDGTLTMQSAPVLMVASDMAAPCICDDDWQPEGGEMNLMVTAATHRLFYEVLNPEVLEPWADIISSVDVFISAPFYTYSQEGTIRVAQSYDESATPYAMRSTSVCSMDPDGIIEKKNAGIVASYNECQPRTLRDMYTLTYYDVTGSELPSEQRRYFIQSLHEPLRVQEKPSAEVFRDIASCSLFYFLRSFPVSHVSGGTHDMEIPENYLESLVAREVMTDDYDSHASLLPGTMFMYNNRLSVADITQRLFAGYGAAQSLQHTGGYHHIAVDNGGYVFRYVSSLQARRMSVISAVVRLRKNGREMVAAAPAGTFGFSTPVYYYYFPDRDAYQVDVVVRLTTAAGQEVSERYYSLPLRPHDFLNGAVYCGIPGLERDFFYYYRSLSDAEVDASDPSSSLDVAARHSAFHNDEYQKWEAVAPYNGNVPVSPAEHPLPAPTPAGDYKVVMPAKIYTSAAGNPFAFPFVGINTIGSGRILALTAATKALSEGQYGMFPLIIFTSEGIWTMRVTDEGSFASPSPLTHDVCTRPSAVVPTDSAVLFFTQRGLMLLSGSRTVCLSEDIRHRPSVSAAQLPSLGVLLSGNVPLPDDDFLSYVAADAAVAYDYVARRIMVFSPFRKYSYVFDVDRELWGVMPGTITGAVCAFPDSYVMVRSGGTGSLAVFRRSDPPHSSAPSSGVIITRPLSFGIPGVYKTVRSLIVRGRFPRSSVSVVLYGSPDLVSWLPVAASSVAALRNISGTPYKYFIVAVRCSLAPGQYVSGVSVDYVTKLTSKLR